MKIIISHSNGITHDVNGDIPWYDKNSFDIQLFKIMTMDCKNITMGRKTYDSLPQPLDGRNNIVISRANRLSPLIRIRNDGDLDNAVTKVTFIKDIPKDTECIIGGMEIINSYINKYGSEHIKLFLTKVETDIKISGDVHDINQLVNNFDSELELFKYNHNHPKLGKCKFTTKCYFNSKHINHNDKILFIG